MKKFVAITLLLSFVLSSCWSEEAIVEDSRTEVLIQTLKLSGNTGSYDVEKTARLTAGSALSLPSDGIGQVEQILVKEGQSVKKGDVIVKLKDTAAMYGIQMQQASNGVASASAAREATLANLDQAVTNAEISLAQAQRTYDTLQKDVKERRKQAENDYYNANPNNTGSTAQLSIEKLKLDLASAENNYQNQLASLDSSFHLYANDFEKLANTMLYNGDLILGITSTNQYKNDSWEAYLWSYIGNIKVTAENNWNALYGARGAIRAKVDTKITMANAKAEIDALSQEFQTARDFWASMDTMLQNSVVGAGLSQDMLTAWITQWSWLRTAAQGSEATFTTWKNNILSIIPSATGAKSVAEMNIESLRFQVATAERNIQTGNDSATIGHTRTIIALDDSLQAAKLSLDQATKNLAAAKRNRDATARQLGASVNSASTSLALARANYDKLTIKAPVDGKVTRINVAVGQSINTGSPVAEMASKTPEMTVDTEADVALNLMPWDTVKVLVWETELTGSIVAVSHIANANLLYTTRISVPTETTLIWQAAKVVFHIENTHSFSDISLPLRSVNIISENEGEITILTHSGNNLIPERKTVRLGNPHNESIEIKETFTPDTEIILNDVSNFDSTKQKLTVNNDTVSGEVR